MQAVDHSDVKCLDNGCKKPGSIQARAAATCSGEIWSSVQPQLYAIATNASFSGPFACPVCKAWSASSPPGEPINQRIVDAFQDHVQACIYRAGQQRAARLAAASSSNGSTARKTLPLPQKAQVSKPASLKELAERYGVLSRGSKPEDLLWRVRRYVHEYNAACDAPSGALPDPATIAAAVFRAENELAAGRQRAAADLSGLKREQLAPGSALLPAPASPASASPALATSASITATGGSALSRSATGGVGAGASSGSGPDKGAFVIVTKDMLAAFKDLDAQTATRHLEAVSAAAGSVRPPVAIPSSAASPAGHPSGSISAVCTKAARLVLRWQALETAASAASRGAVVAGSGGRLLSSATAGGSGAASESSYDAHRSVLPGAAEGFSSGRRGSTRASAAAASASADVIVLDEDSDDETARPPGAGKAADTASAGTDSDSVGASRAKPVNSTGSVHPMSAGTAPSQSTSIAPAAAPAAVSQEMPPPRRGRGKRARSFEPSGPALEIDDDAPAIAASASETAPLAPQMLNRGSGPASTSSSAVSAAAGVGAAAAATAAVTSAQQPRPPQLFDPRVTTTLPNHWRVVFSASAAAPFYWNSANQCGQWTAPTDAELWQGVSQPPMPMRPLSAAGPVANDDSGSSSAAPSAAGLGEPPATAAIAAVAGGTGKRRRTSTKTSEAAADAGTLASSVGAMHADIASGSAAPQLGLPAIAQAMLQPPSTVAAAGSAEPQQAQAPRGGDWQCGVCTLLNKARLKKCNVCGAHRTAPSANAPSSASAAAGGGGTSGAAGGGEDGPVVTGDATDAAALASGGVPVSAGDSAS